MPQTREGDLPEGTDGATLVRYSATILDSLAVQAASRATETELQRITAMRAWPA